MFGFDSPECVLYLNWSATQPGDLEAIKDMEDLTVFERGLIETLLKDNQDKMGDSE